MSTATITTNSKESIQHTVDEIITDKQALEDKTKMMSKMRWNSLLNSVNRMATFFSAIMLSVGMATIVPLLKNVTSFSDTLSTIAGSEVGMVFMGMAALTTVIAVGTDYVASRIWQGGQFDNFELNAQSTARHLVQELKASRTTSVSEEHSQNVRADGKKWVQVVKPEQQMPVRT